jgi:FeS assembly SUF system regulator
VWSGVLLRHSRNNAGRQTLRRVANSREKDARTTMLSMSRKTDYALVALAHLARQCDGKTVSARHVAEEYGLPLPMLMQVLKELQRGGVVESERGAHGGYALARSPRDVTVLNVIELIEGPVRVSMCCDDEEDGEPCAPCALLSKCPITDPVRELNQRLVDLLRNVSLADLIAKGEADETADRDGMTVPLTVST